MGKRKQKKSVLAKRELVFDEEKRKEYLTGFHKRKLQRRKAAVEEIKRKIKEEQKKMRDERHKEYMKMLKEREEALEEADEIERLCTSTTESVIFDHPNHTVTVTTISDLDLSGVGLLPPGTFEKENEEKNEEEESKTMYSLPKKANEPLLSKRICSLTKSLHARNQQKSKKRPQKVQDKKQTAVKITGRTSKAQRRRQTGRTGRNKE
ncbi:nucleolar protein 12 [Leptodactylus fuscus]|uniref:nucleolar protein 12 n=1 Tax=Leptodactylus fuscus TaxID=238119 RepID=UPI003F4E4C93